MEIFYIWYKNRSHWASNPLRGDRCWHPSIENNDQFHDEALSIIYRIFHSFCLPPLPNSSYKLGQIHQKFYQFFCLGNLTFSIRSFLSNETIERIIRQVEEAVPLPSAFAQQSHLEFPFAVGHDISLKSTIDLASSAQWRHTVTISVSMKQEREKSFSAQVWLGRRKAAAMPHRVLASERSERDLGSGTRRNDCNEPTTGALHSKYQ